MRSIFRSILLYLIAAGVFLAIGTVNLGLAIFLALISIAAAMGNPNSTAGWGLLAQGMARMAERADEGPSGAMRAAAGAVSRTKKVARFAINPR